MCPLAVALILRDGATVVSGSESMKIHPHGPDQLAKELHSTDMGDVSPDEIRKDMRTSPDLYFVDHVAACDQDGSLPMSEVAWRRACQAA